VLAIKFLITSQGSYFASKLILNLSLPEMDRYGADSPFLIRLLFEFEIFHFCILWLFGMVAYNVLKLPENAVCL
jgi:hypothetical protein